MLGGAPENLFRTMIQVRSSSFPLAHDSRGSTGFPCSWSDQPVSSAFVNCEVFSFVTLDEILWRFTRGVMHVPFEFHVGSDLLDDDSANPTSLGIPSHVITDFECFRHRGQPDPWVQPNDQVDLDIWLTRLSIEHKPVSPGEQ